jgi:hypothetical protein
MLVFLRPRTYLQPLFGGFAAALASIGMMTWTTLDGETAFIAPGRDQSGYLRLADFLT